MNLLEKYNTVRKKLYEHVGFVEEWVIYPIEDNSEYIWDIIGDNDEVRFSETIEKFDDENAGNYYTAEIYKQRFYNKHVYVGADFTMIFGNPGVDVMKWFYVFDNKKRRSEIKNNLRKKKIKKLKLNVV